MMRLLDYKKFKSGRANHQHNLQINHIKKPRGISFKKPIKKAVTDGFLKKNKGVYSIFNLLSAYSLGQIIYYRGVLIEVHFAGTIQF